MFADYEIGINYCVSLFPGNEKSGVVKSPDSRF